MISQLTIKGNTTQHTHHSSKKVSKPNKYSTTLKFIHYYRTEQKFIHYYRTSFSAFLHEISKQLIHKSQKYSQTMRNKIFWSGETKIELFGVHTSHHVWRKSGTVHHQDNGIPTMKHDHGSVACCGTSQDIGK